MDNISLISIIAGILIVAIGAGVSSLVIWKKSGNNKKLVMEFLILSIAMKETFRFIA